MNKRRTIFNAFVALMVIMLGVNFNAEAQWGGLIPGGNLIDKASEKNAKIPKAKKKGKPITFSWQGTTIGNYDPTSLAITFNQKDANGQQVVYKIDPTTGAVTNHAGASKGSMSDDGSLESPNLGTLTVKKKEYPNFDVIRNSQVIGTVRPDRAIDPSGKKFGEFAEEVSPLLVAYVFFGALLSEEQAAGFSSGYGIPMTTAELEDMIEWNDQESINKIIKYESSLPCAGFKDTHPEFKNCKIAAVGLRSNEWREKKETDSYGYTNWFYEISYWVVYELTDGRNIVTFSTAREKSKYGDVISKKQTKTGDFHEVTDWKRK